MNESIKDFKKYWWVVYLILTAIYIILGLSGAKFWGLFGLNSIVIFWFMIIPLFFIIGLVLNIVKNNQNKLSIFRDWKFWLWLIPLIICIMVFIVTKFS